MASYVLAGNTYDRSPNMYESLCNVGMTLNTFLVRFLFLKSPNVCRITLELEPANKFAC